MDFNTVGPGPSHGVPPVPSKHEEGYLPERVLAVIMGYLGEKSLEEAATEDFFKHSINHLSNAEDVHVRESVRQLTKLIRELDPELREDDIETLNKLNALVEAKLPASAAAGATEEFMPIRQNKARFDEIKKNLSQVGFILEMALHHKLIKKPENPEIFIIQILNATSLIPYDFIRDKIIQFLSMNISNISNKFNLFTIGNSLKDERLKSLFFSNYATRDEGYFKPFNAVERLTRIQHIPDKFVRDQTIQKLVIKFFELKDFFNGKSIGVFPFSNKTEKETNEYMFKSFNDFMQLVNRIETTEIRDQVLLEGYKRYKANYQYELMDRIVGLIQDPKLKKDLQSEFVQFSHDRLSPMEMVLKHIETIEHRWTRAEFLGKICKTLQNIEGIDFSSYEPLIHHLASCFEGDDLNIKIQAAQEQISNPELRERVVQIITAEHEKRSA